MNKRLILLALTFLLACTLASCALLREPWPASEGYETTAPDVTQVPPRGDGPDATPVPTGKPVTEPDYNG
jgi:hypothetical protein